MQIKRKAAGGLDVSAKNALRRWIALLACCLLLPALLTAAAVSDDDPPAVPILVYHRFGPSVADRMTLTTPVFEAHLRHLRDHGYTVITLRRLLAAWRGEMPAPPARSVVITVDDGHASVHTQMFPLIRRYGVPVTLFIYPSAISNAAYALTWAQLGELVGSGLVEIQSHSYWHPNFRDEKRRLPARAYEQLVRSQLLDSRRTLQDRLGVRVDLLAWPFGIYDQELIEYARDAGYIAAVTLEHRHARPIDSPMALPRYLLTESDRGAAFARLLAAPHVRSGVPKQER
jgi:peptidoglycan/xylan/chitin deacetylase (PgdA/CDA1 family)